MKAVHLASSQRLRAVDLRRLQLALSSARTSASGGSTHGFYHYPARFSPDIARAVIKTFSAPGDSVLDPFMGGGTSIIEGLTLGRRMLGVDINSLAHFIARVRTTPISTHDELSLRRWARRCAMVSAMIVEERDDRVRNLPETTRKFLAGALQLSNGLRTQRRRQLARCALLRLGQWALDCRDFVPPRRERLADQLVYFSGVMITGLREFVARCRDAGIARSEIRTRRRLLCRNVIGIDSDERLISASRPRLVFTSPPYPSVHVLYHRWQYRGRRETGAPYWIANLRDGRPGSFYTGGSRTRKGRADYFKMIASAFASVRNYMDPTGVVVQLVGFSDAASQLPDYLGAMELAGFREDGGTSKERHALDRRVPNRKWYARLQGDVDASTEMLLLHRPA